MKISLLSGNKMEYFWRCKLGGDMSALSRGKRGRRGDGLEGHVWDFNKSRNRVSLNSHV